MVQLADGRNIHSWAQPNYHIRYILHKSLTTCSEGLSEGCTAKEHSPVQGLSIQGNTREEVCGMISHSAILIYTS